MRLEGLGDPILEIILSKLDSRSVATFACVNSRCRAAASDPVLWRAFCSRDFDLQEPLDPDGSVCPSFKVAYRRWQESFGAYPYSLIKRTKKCWDDIRLWMAANFPEVGSSLQKGASEAEIQKVEDELGVKLPSVAKLLYRFCNGQNTLENCDLSLMGLIGGYVFYQHLVNVHFLPLTFVIGETRQYASRLSYYSHKFIVVAVSCHIEKNFLLDCTNGGLFVSTRNFETDGEMLPCVPPESVGTNQEQDAFLRWLEEHSKRLQDGKIRVREIHQKRYICLFPELPPSCTTAITNGIQVRASAVFVPELCDVTDAMEQFYFAYSIRMSLLPEGGILDGTPFSSCQLLTRHWIIRAQDEVVSDVLGEAVIGKFPRLIAGKPEFVYESCTALPVLPGSIEGSFAFVPGRIVSPEGREFVVEVACVGLEIPGFIF